MKTKLSLKRCRKYLDQRVFLWMDKLRVPEGWRFVQSHGKDEARQGHKVG